MSDISYRTAVFLAALASVSTLRAQPTVTSAFDMSLDGWTAVGFEIQFGFPPSITRVVNAADIEFSMDSGNPGGYARLTDALSDPGSFASAPAEFLGDLSAYKDGGSLSFDHRLFSAGVPNSGIQSYNAFIVSGNPNNFNFLIWDGAPAPAGATDWVHFEIPLNESAWSPFFLASMSFDEILANVTEILLPFELVDNDGNQNQEHGGLDNATLSAAVANSGDFNGNGNVDAADYTVWRDGLGTLFTPADYDTWKMHYGTSAGGGAQSTVAVPEPVCWWLWMAGAAATALSGRIARWPPFRFLGTIPLRQLADVPR